MILHGLKQGIHRFKSEVVLAPSGYQGIGLIDEKHAAHGFLHDLHHLGGRLAYVLGHQARTVHLNQMPLGKHANLAVDPGKEAGHRSLSRSRVSREDQMQGHLHLGQTSFLPHLHDLDHVGQGFDILLDLLQANQRIQLGHEFL